MSYPSYLATNLVEVQDVENRTSYGGRKKCLYKGVKLMQYWVITLQTKMFQFSLSTLKHCVP